MKKIKLIVCMISMFMVFGGAVQANEITLLLNANDIFISAAEDDTRLNQQGEARRLWDTPTGRYYLTYNLESIAGILGWDGVSAGYQGVSHLQLWFHGAAGNTWGEQVVRSSFSSASVNGEYDWTADVSTDYVHFNTVLGGEGHQNAISPFFKPAETLWSVTGDFFFDNNNNGTLDAGIDEDLAVGQEYTIWFNAAMNNWRCLDAYGNDNWGNPDIEGTIIAVAVPQEIAADIAECAMAAKNHGHFASCVSHVTLAAKRAGVISPKEKGAITSWAAQANIP